MNVEELGGIWATERTPSMIQNLLSLPRFAITFRSLYSVCCKLREGVAAP